MEKKMKMKMKKEREVALSSLPLETYALLFNIIRGCHGDAFTREHLLQVLKIHGLSNAIKLNKNTLLQRLSAADIFDPHRSSIDLGNFECDLTAEEIERDLEALGWLDCPSKSVNGLKSNPAQGQEYCAGVPLPQAKDESAIFGQVLQCAAEVKMDQCSSQISRSELLLLHSVTSTE